MNCESSYGGSRGAAAGERSGRRGSRVRVVAATNSTTAWCGIRTVSSTSPRRSTSVATVCFSGKRGSNRYSRMLVSTSAATGIEILAPPAAVPSRAAQMRSCLTALLALSRTLKQTQPRFEIQGGNLPAGRNDADHLTSGDPFDLVARTDPELLAKSLGQRHLAFAGYPCPPLTLPRPRPLPS